MLRFGSSGAPVRHLQTALNLDPGGVPLATDGLFGLRTHGRVAQYQAHHGAAPDGIVGPVTMGLLQPLYDLLDAGLKRLVAEKERQLRGQIKRTAENFQSAWGWDDKKTAAPDPQMPNIAIRYMRDAATRERQGGRALHSMFTFAGANARHVGQTMHIAPGYAKSERDEKLYKTTRNADLVSYCGIFALFVLRLSGIRVWDWQVSGQLTGQAAKVGEEGKKNWPLRAISPAEVGIGDIGVRGPTDGTGHHFIVVGRNQHLLETVEGNAGLYHSVVRKQVALANHKSTVSKTTAQMYWYNPVTGETTTEVALLSAFPHQLGG